MKNMWIFPAITCLLLSFLFLRIENQLIILILFFIWILRLYFLKDISIWKYTFISSFIFIIVLFGHISQRHSNLDGTENRLVVYPEATSIEIDGDYLKFKGKVLNDDFIYKEKVYFQYYFKNEIEKEEWLHNPPIENLIINGELEKPQENTNFYQFNYQRYLKQERIFWIMKMEHYDDIVFENVKKPIFSIIEKYRFQLLNYINKYFKSPTTEYIKILFFADNREMSEEIMQGYRILGVLHLFSISGFHISFLARLLQSFFLKLGLSIESTDLLVLLLLPLYGLFVGFKTSIFRAVFQTTLLLFTKMLDKPVGIVNAWSLTMLGALLINPFQIHSLSFQLSYLISGGLIMFSQQKWVKKLTTFNSMFLFSTISFLISIPILIYHFHEFSWVTLIANVIFVPLFSFFFFPFLFVLFMLSFFIKETILFQGLLHISNQLIKNMEKFLLFLTNQFNFSFIVGHLPIFIGIVLIICMIKILVNIEQRQKISLKTILSLLACLFYHTLSPVGYVLMLDVNQGDSIVIKEPNSQKITMIDTGGKLKWSEAESWQRRESDFSIGENLVVPSLKAFGISKINRLYITHAHEDHMGEMARIHKSLPIQEIATTIETFEADNFQQLYSNLEDIPFVPLQSPDKLEFPTNNTYLLSPIKQYTDKNNQSLVMYVKIGEDDWLFTGDMEKEAEADFVKTYPKLKIDYLKIAHHGSNTSSTEEFVKWTQPENALISLGKNNMYNHPSEEVLERLIQNNIKTNITAEDGAIIVKYYKIPFINRWFIKKETVVKS